MSANDTWELILLPKSAKLIGNKWVFKMKLKVDRSLKNYKTRVVENNYDQTYDIGYRQTFNPVVKPIIIRVILIMALSKSWVVRQIDVNNVFLNGELEEDVFMVQPKGFVNTTKPHNVCKLKKALYSLNEAPFSWFTKFSKCVIYWSFKCSSANTSMLVYKFDNKVIFF